MNEKTNSMGRSPLELPSPFKVNADCTYPYVAKSRLSRRRSRLWCALVSHVLGPALHIFTGFEVEGKQNLKSLQNGAVSFCNHVHTLDCVMLGRAFWSRDTYFLSQRENFGIPLIRHLIKRLKAMPVPENSKAYSELYRQLEPELLSGAIFHVYPEGSLRPSCTVLRPFSPGAFRFAVNLGLPVLPCVIRFERGRFRTRHILVIGEPLFPQKDLPPELQIEKLKTDSELVMEGMLENKQDTAQHMELCSNM